MADASSSPAALSPKDLALLLLASGDLRPRQRARDQQADLAGLALKRKLLLAVVARDPEPDALEAALAEIVALLGEPAGPARAIASSFLDDWQAAQAPAFVAWLLEQALVEGQRPLEQHPNKCGRGRVAAFDAPAET
jgi:hypothetical protein